MEIIINDTNILLDLIKLDLLDHFFTLDADLRTVDFVVNEISDPNQQKILSPFIESGKLFVKNFSSEEIEGIFDLQLQCRGNLSITDVSVIFYAKNLQNCRILTGDKQMKNKAQQLGIKVNGILFVFDLLLHSKILSPPEAIEKLQELKRINRRLPHSEIEKLINNWS